MNWGTAISNIATPIGYFLRVPCVSRDTGKLLPDSTCAKVRDHLDAGRWGDALYDFIWRKNGVKQEEETTIMKDWIIIHQLGIQAETYMDAMQGIKDAETIAITVQQRQQPQPPIQLPARQVTPGAAAVKIGEEPTKSEKK